MKIQNFYDSIQLKYFLRDVFLEFTSLLSSIPECLDILFELSIDVFSQLASAVSKASFVFGNFWISASADLIGLTGDTFGGEDNFLLKHCLFNGALPLEESFNVSSFEAAAIERIRRLLMLSDTCWLCWLL